MMKIFSEKYFTVHAINLFSRQIVLFFFKRWNSQVKTGQRREAGADEPRYGTYLHYLTLQLASDLLLLLPTLCVNDQQREIWRENRRYFFCLALNQQNRFWNLVLNSSILSLCSTHSEQLHVYQDNVTLNDLF